MPAPAKTPKAVYDPSDIVIGLNPEKVPVVLPERPRLEHLHAIGATGSGKTNFLEHCIRQDIARGCGVCVVDPHGNHPGSLYRSLLVWLNDKGYSKSRIIHLIDPNAPTHTVGFNPLERPDPETDLSVIAGITLNAFERVWGGEEDSRGTPTIRRVLKATFTALAELGLTLAEAELLFDPHDIQGVRAWAIAEVKDRYARRVLSELHQMSLAERSKREFRAEIVGPINRIAEFVSAPAIRTIIGQTARTISMRAALDEGHIILANLAPGKRVHDDDAELLGRLLGASVFSSAKRRHRPDRPFWFYLDECQRYLSGEIADILAEVRKYGVGVILSHQWLGQLEDAGESVLSAVLNGPNLKAVFRLKDPTEAGMLAETVIPFDLETPVKTLIKPTVVGHTQRVFRNWNTSEHEATGRAVSESAAVSISQGAAEGITESEAFSEGSSDIAASAAGDATSTAFMTPETGWMATPSMTTTASSASQSIGSASSSSHVAGRSTSSVQSSAVAKARGKSAVDSVMHGTSRTEGFSEGIEPVYDNLPGGVHSLENVRYTEAQKLRSLKTGEAYLAYVGMEGWRGSLVHVPPVQSNKVSDDAFIEIRTRMLDASPSALPADRAQALVNEREQKVFAAAAAMSAPRSEPKSSRTKPSSEAKPEAAPEEPESWRVAAPKRKAKPRGRSHGSSDPVQNRNSNN
jgi:hypothetical protein